MTPLIELGTFFQADGARHYTDADINQVALLLLTIKDAWAQVPRLYMILRIIECEHLLDDFIAASINDYWLPLPLSLIQSILKPKDCFRFSDVQSQVLPQSVELSSSTGSHFPLLYGSILPVQHCGLLFDGNSHVDMVVGPPTKLYAIRKETHASYTDPDFLGLIFPIAETSLSNFLDNFKPSHLNMLRKFFGCLATGLCFLHEMKVRHKDIKPQNILVDQGTVLFTDFGISRDWYNEVGDTTDGPTRLTQRYATPEVGNYDARNSSSDIFSLGAVFLEMASVLYDRERSDIGRYFLEQHDAPNAYYRHNLDLIPGWMEELKTSRLPSVDEVCFLWITSMIKENPEERPTSHNLQQMITNSANTDNAFCRNCTLEQVDDKSGRLSHSV
ncbi:kinase-like domain-containing protein [Pyrenochaeta sp. MPI-SDFR-AT-0127]|nr:kinase-like domain-containing protein [Pyrenochaeta sp. MPI-SDFR-AT-0127]